MLVAFPTGRLETRWERFLIGLGYFDTTVMQLGGILFLNTSDPDVCNGCPANPLLISDQVVVSGIFYVLQSLIGIFGVTAIGILLVRRWRAASPAIRGALGPVLIAGVLTLFLLGLSLLGDITGVPDGTAEDVIDILSSAAMASVPFAFLIGLLHSRLSRAAAVSDLVARLGEAGHRQGLRDALAETLADPSLSLAYWVPEQDRYVDAEGHAVEMPARDGNTACTPIEHEGRVVAMICHDAMLDTEPELIETVASAAGLAVENERLNAELRARVEELRASRARIVRAADEERRRLERDLHDGAQQRLVSLALNLRLAGSKLDSDPPAAKELLEETASELGEATTELRELARGLHPAVLSDRGLRPALEALAGRAPVPVELAEPPAERLPAPVEAASYFVVAEALTNVARYARATHAAVSVSRSNGQVEVEVRRRRRRRRRPASGLGAAWARRPRRGARRAARGRQPPRRGDNDPGRDPMRVVVADDSVLLREGVVRLLEDAGMEVVGQAGDAEDLLRKVRAHKPDVAVVDVRMPPSNTDDGLRAAQEIRAELPEVAVLVLSQYVEESYALELLADSAEGVGYLLKDRVAEVDRFVDAVRRVADGGSALDPEVVSQLLGRRRRADPLAELTPREREVLGLMAEGRTNHAIAEELVVSERAVEKHVTSIFAKLDLTSTPHDHRRVLAVLAYLRA